MVLWDLILCDVLPILVCRSLSYFEKNGVITVSTPSAIHTFFTNLRYFKINYLLRH